jgi:uncharacterized protein with HEPN domain
MSRDIENLDDYVGHVLTALERIKCYTDGTSKEAFLCNGLVQDAVVRNLKVIGEECNNIRRDLPAFAARHPELPLQPANEMRKALAYRYHEIDMGVIWATVQELPAMTVQFQALADQS